MRTGGSEPWRTFSAADDWCVNKATEKKCGDVKGTASVDGETKLSVYIFHSSPNKRCPFITLSLRRFRSLFALPGSRKLQLVAFAMRLPEISLQTAKWHWPLDGHAH